MHDLLAFLQAHSGVPTLSSNPCTLHDSSRHLLAIIARDEKLRKVKKPGLVVICGPSGCGKSCLVNRLMAYLWNDTDGFYVSHTTHELREAEEGGVHFHFFSDETSKRSVSNDEFVEHAESVGIVMVPGNALFCWACQRESCVYCSWILRYDQQEKFWTVEVQACSAAEAPWGGNPFTSRWELYSIGEFSLASCDIY